VGLGHIHRKERVASVVYRLGMKVIANDPSKIPIRAAKEKP
jgi:phosphoglycerate dehydrogenase-like enzyme